MTEAAFQQLASWAGIEPDYVDEGGTRRIVSDRVKRMLLDAMGLDARDAETAAASLDRVRRERRSTLTDPVMVWRAAEAPPSPVLRLEPPEGECSIRWRLDREDGERVEGAASLSTLDGPRFPADSDAVAEYRLRLPDPVPHGYHDLHVEAGDATATCRVIVAPRSCHLPSELDEGPGIWGLAHQVYSLRSATNWGLGDFGDLRRLVSGAAELGAGAVGLNPVHSLFPANPAHASPYSPSSRLFLNVAYVDVTAVPDLAECPQAMAETASPAFNARLRDLRQAELVDYPAVVATKLSVLDTVFRHFRDRELAMAQATPSARAASFRRFQRDGGAPLERLGVFEALCEHHGGISDWRRWPHQFQVPDSPEVAAFARDHRDRVEFFQYLQWLAAEQLEAAQDEARASGMVVGLYHDLALGADVGGADVWADRELYASEAAIGAPPDVWNRRGQNWGLPPMNPHVLREQAYEPFVRVLRTLMGRGGALRIDHAMSLRRLFWIPKGGDLNEGAYVRQPFDDLLGVLALESHRNRCLVVGEDLGTVPEGFRERMERENVLSYRLLYFERGPDGGIAAPEDFPRSSAVVVTTHDLPPLPGFWSGHDIEVRARFDLFPEPDMRDQAVEERRAFRRDLVSRLQSEGLLGAGDAAFDRELSDELVAAIYLHLAHSPGRLLMINPEDLLGVVEQINLPGTTDAHPNWRRKLPADLEALLGHDGLRRLAAQLNALRPGRSSGRTGGRTGSARLGRRERS